jgi:choice-of-anchor C domain-containing protein
VKRRSGLGIALGGLAAIALAGTTLAAFVAPTNPSFENVDDTYVDNGSGFQQVNAGDPSITGWTVNAGSVDWIGSYWPAADGAMSIDMSGQDAGTISQTFDTTIGNTYTVSFALAGNPAGPPTIKTLDVIATGGTAANYTFDTTGSDLTNMNWTTAEYTFLATSASTTLSFISTTAGAFGPAIDNVVVSETVPTKDECKDGGWETMIDTSGNAFKNQGDCVSFFATEGKNLGALPPVAAGDVGAASDSKASSQAKQAAKQEAKQEAKATSRTEKAAAKSDAKNKAKSHGAKSHGSKSHKSK